MDLAHQQCIDPACRATFGVQEVHVFCPACAKAGKNSLLDIVYDWDRLMVPKSFAAFEHRWMTKGERGEGALDFSGVWRFRELLPFYRREEDIVTVGEGRTNLQTAELLAPRIGLKVKSGGGPDGGRDARPPDQEMNLGALCSCNTRASTPRAVSRTTA